MSKKFGKALREYRKRAKLSQREFARELGVSAGYLSNVEAGERSPISPLRIVAAAGILNLTDAETDDLLRLALGVPRFDLAQTIASALDRYGVDHVRAVVEREHARRAR